MRKFRFSLFKLPSKSDTPLHLAMVFMALFGLVMAVSASMTSQATTLKPLLMVTLKQFAYFVISYICLLISAKLFTFELARKWIERIVVVTGVLLIATLAFDSVNGAYGWLRFDIGGMDFTIQPSEFAKISMILIIALYLGDLKTKKTSYKDILKKPIAILLTYVFIIVILQRDFGSAVVLLGISFVCFFIPSNICIRQAQNIAVLLSGALGAVVVFIMTPTGLNLLHKLNFLTYQVNRFEIAINPFISRYNTGYQLVNSLIAFTNGGWTGVGLGKSLRKYGYLFAAKTDFILAVIVEELGILGFLAIFIGYSIIICRLLQYAFKIKNEKAKIVLVGVATYIFIHFVFNVGGVTALIPLTGVPLLLISSGGSSTMAVMMAIGICQAIISQYRRGILQ